MLTELLLLVTLVLKILQCKTPMESAEAGSKFREFLQTYEASLSKKRRAVISLNDIRKFSKDLVAEITNNPLGCIPQIEEELNDFEINHIGLSGALGRHSVTPRTISSSHMNMLVSIEGIVTSVSLVRPKLQRSVHYCEAKGCFYYKDYRDATMITRLAPTSTIYPHKDSEGNILSPEFGLSHYADYQSVVIQEMPEISPPGSLPRSCECVFSEDLVDSVKPGDRVRVYGIYKGVVQGNQFPSYFRTIVIVNNIEHLKQNLAVVVRAEPPVEERKDTFALLSSSPLRFLSIAPSIYGHDEIKKALALMMVGGNEIVMNNGSKIRGDINILLIGDPSTAKSQLLRYVLNFMPLSVATTGKGSSGVGLTAAVITDKETGERRLEAGAMVLADRGVCCIDEFDKMNEQDRVAMHEVMEQQTVTIAKAGIHTTLNARCSILAAANPIMGSYNDRVSVQDNIKLPESLLTRFDLVFITLDSRTVEDDTKISQHVLRMHTEDQQDEAISQDVFREYLMYAKRLRPIMSREAAEYISAEYTQLRQLKGSKNLVVNITPRILDTLVRLSIAHAKLRLSEVVEVEDTVEAVSMLRRNIQHNPTRKRSQSKKVCVEERPQVSTVAEMQANFKDEILTKIWKWREDHPGVSECSVSEFGGLTENIQGVIDELVSQDIIAYEDGKIYFFD